MIHDFIGSEDIAGCVLCGGGRLIPEHATPGSDALRSLISEAARAGMALIPFDQVRGDMTLIPLPEHQGYGILKVPDGDNTDNGGLIAGVIFAAATVILIAAALYYHCSA